MTLFPAASQEIIKQFGTNGGGLFNANSAHPFENPNAWTNLIEEVAMNTLSFACVVAFGRVAMARKDARALVAAMLILVTAAASVIYLTETQVPPRKPLPMRPPACSRKARRSHRRAFDRGLDGYDTGASDGGTC